MKSITECKGQCHCGEVTIEATLSRPLSGFNLRKCDCDFCQLHKAAYFSDPLGSLKISSRSELGKYKQGSKTADFLFCKHCGVLIAVTYEDSGSRFAAVSGQVMNDRDTFGSEIVVSPKKLNVTEKTSRWREVWFPNVEIK